MNDTAITILSFPFIAKSTVSEYKFDAVIVVDGCPLKRIGTPEEVAVMILFLTSDWGNFITGECFTISGGDWL